MTHPQPQSQEPPQPPWDKALARDCTTSRSSASITRLTSICNESITGMICIPSVLRKDGKKCPKYSCPSLVDTSIVRISPGRLSASALSNGHSPSLATPYINSKSTEELLRLNFPGSLPADRARVTFFKCWMVAVNCTSSCLIQWPFITKYFCHN